MKKKKVGIIASSVAAIAVCSSMVVGSTFALFTGEDKVNIAVTSGNVEVVANIGNHSDNVTVNGKEVSLTNIVAGEEATISLDIVNKSTVSVKYRLGLNVTNDNGLFAGLNVGVSQDGLDSTGEFDAATDKEDGDKKGTMTVSISLPDSKGVNAYMNKTCSIELSVEAVQGNADFTNSVSNVELINNVGELEAFRDKVNGGATYANKYVVLMSDIDLNGAAWTPIGNAEWKSNRIAGSSLKFDDMAFGETDTEKYITFAGTFNGNGHKISNFNVGSDENREDVVGLFGTVGYARNRQGGSYKDKERSQITAGAVTNLTVKNAQVFGNQVVGGVVGYLAESSIVSNVRLEGNGETEKSSVNGHHFVGGIVGYAFTQSLINACSAENISVSATPAKTDDVWNDGDKVGGIVGYAEANIINCTIENSTLSAYRDFGGIVGYDAHSTYLVMKEEHKREGLYRNYENEYVSVTVEGNTVKNIVLNYNTIPEGEIYDKGTTPNQNAGAIAGRIGSKNEFGVVSSGITYSNANDFNSKGNNFVVGTVTLP